MTDPDVFSVHVSRNKSRKYSMMRFNVPMDVPNWNKKDIEIERDMSKKRSFDLRSDANPQFGEGSEYRAREKEIARKMALGHRIRQFNIDAQNWKLTSGDFKADKKADRKLKKFNGTKVGGIDDSSMYFVMHQREGGIFEAFPVQDWYNFKPEIKHRTLTHEEAEVEWERRDQIINKYALMKGKRDDDVVDNALQSKAGTSGRKRDLKIHGNEDERESDEDEFGRDRARVRGKKNVGGKSKGGEAYEDSDDGDDEGQEVDYMSDASSDFDEVVKGPEQDPDKAMRGVDEEQKSSSSEESDPEPEEKPDEVTNQSEDEASDEDIEAAAARSALFGPVPTAKSSSRSNTPTEELKKRAPTPNHLKRVREKETGSPSLKRPRDSPTPGTGITVEAVRNIFLLKPTTSKELLKKFKTKKTGLTQEQSLAQIASIMKKLESEVTKTKKDGQIYYKINSK